MIIYAGLVEQTTLQLEVVTVNDLAYRPVGRPDVRPLDARFSSGPCRKHPGWDLSRLSTDYLGRSHRAAGPKARLADAITRSASLLNLPEDWKLGIVPGSDTGAVEMAMWSLLGERAVDVLVWESFSSDWSKDLNRLGLPTVNVLEADYGALPDLSAVDPANDLVMVYNGTTSGVRVPDLEWISDARQGLVICDATSAAYAMPIDFTKVDVLTWSWQKVLGGEAAHGMLALSPRAVSALESREQPRALPKLFTLTKSQKLINGIFSGETINTPSMLAVEDLHSALDWADDIGGLPALHARCDANLSALNDFVNATAWIDWLPLQPTTRSCTSMCLKIVDPAFTALTLDSQQAQIKAIVTLLADEGIAFDIANYRSAPPGFRIWGGATVEEQDIRKLGPWLNWAYHEVFVSQQPGAVTHG